MFMQVTVEAKIPIAKKMLLLNVVCIIIGLFALLCLSRIRLPLTLWPRRCAEFSSPVIFLHIYDSEFVIIVTARRFRYIQRYIVFT